MKVFVQNLHEGIHEISEELAPGSIALPEPEQFPEALKVDLYIDHFDNAFRFKLHVVTEATFHCDRCLEAYAAQFDENFEQIYQLGAGEFESDDDVEILPEKVTEIDITKAIQDCFLLNRPMHFLCDADCKGLCPVCGINLNKESCTCDSTPVDPRLEKLKDLLK
jgi:uncharacterized protein